MTQPRFPIYDTGYLKNVNGMAMNVDGSSVPVAFQFAPVNGAWFISRLGVMIIDPGTTGPTNFGALAALSNGLKLEIKTNGQVQIVQILKDNVDLTLLFSHNKLSLQTLDATAVPAGWLNRLDYFTGELIFENPIVLKAGKGDYIRATVQDNLTGLETFRMMYKAFRETL